MPVTQSKAPAVAGGQPAWTRAFRRMVATGKPRSAAPVRCEEPPAAAVPPLDGAPVPKPDTALSFENFSKEWRQTSEQDNWDGFRVEVISQVTKALQASQTLILGTQMRETGYIYQFGPVFQTEGGRTTMFARVGLDGGVTGRWIQKIGSGFEMKASSFVHLKDQQRNMHDAALDYTGKDFTFGLKAAWQGALLAGGTFSQRILPSLMVGGDLTYVQVNSPFIIGQVGARYSAGGHNVTVSLTRQPDMKSPIQAPSHEVKVQYLRKLNERLSLGTEYKYSHPDKESGLSMAYEYTFRNARVQGLLDTDGKVSCSIFDIQGMGFSGMIDYWRGDYKFGVMMQVAPQDPPPPQQ